LMPTLDLDGGDDETAHTYNVFGEGNMRRRHFIKGAAGVVLASAASPFGFSAGLRADEINTAGPEENRPTVPDTLDLVDMAKLGLNGLTRALDPNYQYEAPTWIRFAAKPPYLLHAKYDFECQGKWWESLPLLRSLSGSDLNQDIEERFTHSMLNHVADDGLFYTGWPDMPPWHETNIGTAHNYPHCGVPYANILGNSRDVMAMMIYYQQTHDPEWLKRAERTCDALSRIAVVDGDMAYYPDGGCGTAFSYPKTGWRTRQAPPTEHFGGEGSTLIYQGTVIRGLTRWYVLSGDENALRLAAKMVKFCQRSNMWTWWQGTPPDDIVVTEHAQWEGHFHGHTTYLRALLDYANATDDETLKEFVREGYEYARTKGFARVGCFGEGCSTADMIALAIRLSVTGVGDYWDDVSHYVRNHFVELQFSRPADLRAISEASVHLDPKLAKERNAGDFPTPGLKSTDDVIARALGTFSGDGGIPTQAIAETLICCTGNCTNAIYYTWEATLREIDPSSVQVNLLLNRVSTAMDVESSLPYRGKVVLRNKTARMAALRIPAWVSRKTLRVRVNDRDTAPPWAGNYIILNGLRQRDVVTAEFTLPEETSTYTLAGKKPRQYTFSFKGDTCLGVAGPSEDPVGYSLYQRDHYKTTEVATKRAPSFVSQKTYVW
jgi:hypothetical protein